LAGLCAAGLAAIATALAAAPASAVIVRLRGGHVLSYQALSTATGAIKPFDQFFTNLDYNGGPIMASNTNYAVYWSPSGSGAYPPEYQSGVNQYLTDLAHDSGGHENTDSVSAQYNDAAGEFANYNSHFGGGLLDTDPYPANGCKQATICLTDAQLRSELSKFVKAQGLPTDLAHEYFLLTPKGVEDCFEASALECSAGSKRPVYCAYHGNVALTGGGELIYANDPYVTGIFGCDDGNHPNGSTSDGVIEGGLSHEHNESITDPEPNDAWTDFATGERNGYEIGDKCSTANGTPLGTATNGANYNQVINGHLYWYQEEWSNQGHRCLQRFSFSGTEPTASFTSTPGPSNEAKFNASASTAPGGVSRYSWQFGDGSAPAETTSPTIAHKFTSKGAFVVALTVYAADGTSIGTARTIEAGSVVPSPTVETKAASSLTQTSAVLNASVDPNGREVTECKLEYGATTAYGSSAACSPAPGSGTSPVGVSAPVSGLSANTSYHFRVRATNLGGTSYGEDATLSTLPNSPATVTGSAWSVRSSSAVLNATVNPNGGEVGECKLEYGLTTTYGSSAGCAPSPGSGNSTVAVSGALSGLSASTTYHFRISATGPGGTGTGSDETFTTLPDPVARHWYRNGVKATAGMSVPAVLWGGASNVALSSTAIGEINCSTVAGGSVEDPEGGGAGISQISQFAFYACKAPQCEASVKEQFGGVGRGGIVAENLPWSGEVFEGGAPMSMRERIGQPFAFPFGQPSAGEMKLTGICEVVATGTVVSSDVFEGELQPEIGAGASEDLNGLSAARPSAAKFAAGASTGTLYSEGGGEATFSGQLKYLGYGSQEVLSVGI
jgi:hypothetical protein